MNEIRAALAVAGHAVLQAPAGAGKTTVVPLRLLDQAWLAGQRIVMLEPRRLATRAAAARMASLLGEPVGATIGYTTRDERRMGPDTRVEVVTDGILTRRLQHDAELPGVGLIVFDEIHERNLQSDLALALALDVRAGLRPDLRLLAMSATLDSAPLAAILGRPDQPARLIVSDGRQFPVETRWTPLSRHRPLEQAVAAAVMAAVTDDEGDVLVFLPGAGEIRRVQARLSGTLPGPVDVLPLFGALPVAEQDAALAGSQPGRRRVVLATDIAETSLTVEGVRVVVDAGLSRSPRYHPGSGLTRLHTAPASRSSADQRAGRAGRQGPGVAYRLWSEHQHLGRRRFPQPEIETVDLAGLVLELALWGAGPSDLAFLEPPPRAAFDQGRAVLAALGALDPVSGRPTADGRRMADLPLHPRLARMVIGAEAAGVGGVACALAALVEDRDILRGRPDDVGVDVAERVRLIADADFHHHLVDHAALTSARRRTVALGRRAGIRPGPIDLGECGRVLALAYPDRVAQARGHGRFRLRTGRGAWMAESDPLAGEAFLVVAHLDGAQRDSRIRLAAALDRADLEAAAAVPVTTSTVVTWDAERDNLRATVTRSLDGLVLSTTEQRVAPGPEASSALLQHVRAAGLGVLPWTDAARLVQRRALFVRRIDGEDDRWPDLSDAALLTSIDEWLAPRLEATTGRAGLSNVDMTQALRTQLGHSRLDELDRLAPVSVPTGAGRKLRVDYRPDQPTAQARIQELFGINDHPTVGDGRVPLVLHLLSPAGRPVQVTADLPGFWAGSYAVVRKELAGRYPKHRWPAEPADPAHLVANRSRKRPGGETDLPYRDR